jgi:hypothetical protein
MRISILTRIGVALRRLRHNGRATRLLAQPADGPKPPVKLCVISGFYPGRRFNSHVNHAAYSHKHGYYCIDASSPSRDPRPYFHKVDAIEQYLDQFDWVFWIDDDAYFTDFSRPLHMFLSDVGEQDMVICRSPATKTLHTKFSSGQFFLRNSSRSHEFLRLAREVDLATVRNSFWEERHGFFTGGDQDAFVYLTETRPEFGEGFVRVLNHDAFNNRDFEFVTKPDEHFLVHFTGKEKLESKREFCRRLGLNKYIVPEEELAGLRWDPTDEGE